MKMTAKNQIVIPKEVRKQLGIGPGDRLLFVATSDTEFEVRVAETEPAKKSKTKR